MAEVVMNGEKNSVATGKTGAIPPNMIVVEGEDVANVVNQGTQKETPVNDTDSKSETPQNDTVAEESPETPPEETNQQEDSEAFIVAGTDMSSFAAEYEKNGKLSDESYKTLASKGFSRELVEAYIRGVENGVKSETELAQKDVDAILKEVGGEERYSQIMAWAADKLTQEEQDAYDEAVSNPNPAIARLVVQGIAARYEREKGRAPALVMGSRSPSPEARAGFKDRSSMIAAMNDKRYGSDPEYTRDVERKVLASGLMRGRR